MCLVHKKLICDCDQELQVAKNFHQKKSRCYIPGTKCKAKVFSSAILLLPSRNHTPCFFPKAAGEKNPFFILFQVRIVQANIRNMSMLIPSSSLTYACREVFSLLPEDSDIDKHFTNEKVLFVDFV